MPPSAAAIAVSATGGPSIVAASVVDLARCLQSSADAACFSGARPAVRAVAAGATAAGAPDTLTATSSGSSVTLTWGAPASGDPVVTYVIEAGSASGLANLATFATNSAATTFSASGVGNGTYYVRVRAQNAAGTSAPSNEAILVVGSAGCTSAPNAPSGLASSASGSTLTLSWNAPSGGCAPTSYILQAGLTPGSSALANSNIGSVTRFVATGVGNGSYYIRVVAANAFGQSAASDEILATVALSKGALSVTVTPNPTPYSGAPFTFCQGNPNTWMYSETIRETNGVGMTVLQRSYSVDGRISNQAASNISIPARGSVSLNGLIWCLSGSGPYTVQTTYHGTDANGNSFSYVGPAVTLLAKTTTTPTGKRTFPAVWVNAQWIGGRTGTPLTSKGIDPVNPFGLLCPANSLVFENHPPVINFNEDQLTVTNNCHRQILAFAVCRTAGSGGGASTIPICAIDPRQTPLSNVYSLVVGSTTNRQPLGQTPIDFDVNVFWCSDTSVINAFLGSNRVTTAAMMDCVER